MPRHSVQYVLDCLPSASWGISLLHAHQQRCPFPAVPLLCDLMAEFHVYLYSVWFRVTQVIQPHQSMRVYNQELIVSCCFLFTFFMYQFSRK